MQTDQPKRRLEALQVLLIDQLNSYHQLLKLAQIERQAITESKIEILDDVITQKAGLVQAIEKLENHRMNLMVDFSSILNLPLEKITIERLANFADQTTSEKLFCLRDDLLLIVKRLQKENDVNKDLMIHSINLMDNSINMLNSLGYQEATYIHTGQFARAEERGGLFRGKV